MSTQLGPDILRSLPLTQSSRRFSRSDVFTTTQKSLQRSGEWCCSRQRQDVYILLTSLLSPSALVTSLSSTFLALLFYLDIFSFCFLFLGLLGVKMSSKRTVNPRDNLLLRSNISSFGHYPEFSPGGRMEQVRRKSGGSHSDICILTFSPSRDCQEVIQSLVCVWKQLRFCFNSLHFHSGPGPGYWLTSLFSSSPPPLLSQCLTSHRCRISPAHAATITQIKEKCKIESINRWPWRDGVCECGQGKQIMCVAVR